MLGFVADNWSGTPDNVGTWGGVPFGSDTGDEAFRSLGSLMGEGASGPVSSSGPLCGRP